MFIKALVATAPISSPFYKLMEFIAKDDLLDTVDDAACFHCFLCSTVVAQDPESMNCRRGLCP